MAPGFQKRTVDSRFDQLHAEYVKKAKHTEEEYGGDSWPTEE